MEEEKEFVKYLRRNNRYITKKKNGIKYILAIYNTDNKIIKQWDEVIWEEKENFTIVEDRSFNPITDSRKKYNKYYKKIQS